MKPSKLKRGDELLIKQKATGEKMEATFIKRDPARSGRKAINYLFFPEFLGMDGPLGDGTCPMSDYDLSRRGELIL